MPSLYRVCCILNHTKLDSNAVIIEDATSAHPSREETGSGNLHFRLEVAPEDLSVPHRPAGRELGAVLPGPRGVTSSSEIPPSLQAEEWKEHSIQLLQHVWHWSASSIDISRYIAIEVLGRRCRSMLKAFEDLTF